MRSSRFRGCSARGPSSAGESLPSIAIVGASPDKSAFGNKAVRAYSSKGWKVYPVNPKYEEIEGLECYRSVPDLPETPDYASLYVLPSVGVHLLDGIAAKGIRRIYVNPGAESDELIAKAKRLGVQPLMACSIRAIGVDPEKL